MLLDIRENASKASTANKHNALQGYPNLTSRSKVLQFTPDVI